MPARSMPSSAYIAPIVEGGSHALPPARGRRASAGWPRPSGWSGRRSSVLDGDVPLRGTSLRRPGGRVRLTAVRVAPLESSGPDRYRRSTRLSTSRSRSPCESPAANPPGRQAGPQGRCRPGQPVPPTARGLPAPGVGHGLQQPARGGAGDPRCPGPQGPGLLRPVRLAGHRLPDRGADRRAAAHPGDRPRLAARP